MYVWSKSQDGREVMACTLKSKGGIEVTLISFAAAIQSLKMPNRQGEMLDLVLGFDTADEYMADTDSFGAIVGRNANRIAGGRCTLGGVEYALEINNGPNNLHSGRNGFQHKLWEVEKETQKSVTFRIRSGHLEQDFPGNMTAWVTYTVDDNNGLTLDYRAVTDADTICNMTSHVYMNMNGHDSGSVEGHMVQIPAEAFTPVHDADCIPTGEIRSVEGTPFDLRQPRCIGEKIDCDDEQIRYGIGYDHNFVLGKWGTLKSAGTIWSPESGIAWETLTDLPGVHFYAGNWLEDKPGKGGFHYKHRAGACMETQFFPDAIHKDNFEGPVLKAGEEYKARTVFRFSVR